VGLVFAVICIVSIIRIIFDIAVNPGNDFLQSNIYDIAVLIIYQMMFIILTFSLLLMVNRTLFDDLEKDINRCEEAEAELRNSEEKFSRTFHASPDAILISRMEDGRIIDVNEGFSRLSGYTHEEALSSTSLSLWTDPADREVLVNSLRKKQVLSNVKMNFRARSGATLSCLYSGVFIKLGGEEYILSVVRDFTEHEQAEKILRIRLEIWEYAYNHSIKEIMVKSLDEIEKLTGSLIGFYHFVNEKEKTLILQVWSTRTRHEYCRAEGEDMHYPLDSAGVWADCVRERRAVIHNDYSSLPNRRGMPAGHASLTRELVVPIMRDNQIVSVLGVGNKPDAYNEKDVVLVSFIADLLWTIVSHKRAEEEIHSLNDQLEKMAMTDHLTGIANNRSFYLQGTEEIKRAVRYRHPLTLVMLDIDKFKVINDTYGHKAGDKILQNIAEILKKSIRNVDFIGRLSGEEFGILMPNTAASDAVVFAERLRAAVEAAECMIGDAIIKVTASFGISNWNDSSGSADIEKLLRQADESMYEAKRQGRNRIIYHDKERKDHDIHI
jgi:diguanylate cyclase (GGDEF)-like protein/PAS domain S-box-containing protein